MMSVITGIPLKECFKIIDERSTRRIKEEKAKKQKQQLK